MRFRPNPLRALLCAALVLAAAALGIWRAPARAGGNVDAEIRALYLSFASAQNARALDRVRPLFLDSRQFLWVSDGMSFWGRDAVLERMSAFQTFEIWRVEPALERAVVVRVGADTAYLHLPLALTLGPRQPGPDTFRFLVSMLAVRTQQGWRIAALFTTREKDG